MMDSDKRMIETQAAHISRLNDHIRDLKQEILKLHDKYEDSLVAAKFYNDLQKHVIENPILQGEWDRFCSILKLVGDEEYLKRAGAY